MKIYSLNGNLFGPNTNEGIVNTVERLRGFQNRPLYEVISIKSSLATLLNGDEISLEYLLEHNVYITNSSFFESDAINNFNNFIERESLLFLDSHPIVKNENLDIASNYPLLLRDYYNFSCFDMVREKQNNLLNGGPESDVGELVFFGGRKYLSFNDVQYLDPQTIFSKNGSPIPFAQDFFSEKNIRDYNNIENKKIDMPVLYLNWSSAHNYNIFMHELVLAAINFKGHYSDIKLFLGPQSHKIEILEAAGFTRDDFILATEPVHLTSVIFPLRKLNLKYLGADFVRMYGELKRSLGGRGSHNKNSLIYLDRKPVASNTGSNRFIINQNELNHLLKKLTIVTQYCEDLTLQEKYSALSNINLLVTPVGANLVNVGLSSNINTIVLIISPVWMIFKWYWYYFMKFTHPESTIILFEEIDVVDNSLSKDPFNKPYNINIDRLEAVLVKIISE